MSRIIKNEFKKKKTTLVAIDKEAIKSERPAVSMTYMEMAGQFSLKDFAQKARTYSDKRLYKALEDFLIKVRQYETIDDLINNHKSHYHPINKDKKSEDKAKEITNTYKLDVKHLFHLHTNTNGNGQFVLHGFRINNRFEIVWLDPLHELHGS